MAETRAKKPAIIYVVEVAMECTNAKYGYPILVKDDGSLDFCALRYGFQNDIEGPERHSSTTIFYPVIESHTSLISASAMSED